MEKFEALLRQMRESLSPETMRSIDGVMAMEVTDIAHYTIDARADGGQGLLEGAPESHELTARFTMSASSDALIKMMSGELEMMPAMVTGQLKIKGDLRYAMKMSQIFDDPTKV